MDQRIRDFAKNIINYSTEIKPDENVMIHCHGTAPQPLVRALVEETYKVGGRPFIRWNDPRTDREILMQATREQLEIKASLELDEMKQMQAYIGIRGGDNINEMGDVPADKLKMSMEIMRPVTQYRVDHTKWVVMRYPNGSMAQSASMSQDAFESFYYKVCTLDYKKMSRAMDQLVQLMQRTDHVHIKGKGTDLMFSIKGIPAIKCDGKMNLPDGEVFTAPVRESVNGQITFNCPAVYQGTTYEHITLIFNDGKIVNATSNDTDKLNHVLDTDEGARYIGEFAIGVNPYILKPMKDTLFDEKIMGSFHFTPGECYEEASNGNASAIHWDLVCIQTPEYGGGEIYFDGVLIRKDGRFVIPELEDLNPERLMG